MMSIHVLRREVADTVTTSPPDYEDISREFSLTAPNRSPCPASLRAVVSVAAQQYQGWKMPTFSTAVIHLIDDVAVRVTKLKESEPMVMVMPISCFLRLVGVQGPSGKGLAWNASSSGVQPGG